MKSDLGQSSEKQRSYFFRDISGMLSLCERGYLSYLDGIFWSLLHRREEYKGKETRKKNIFYFG